MSSSERPSERPQQSPADSLTTSAEKLPPPPPEVAARVFGERLPAVRAYVELLAGAGIERGLIGPREMPRLWDRHVLNSAAVAELIQPDVTVADVGSGAGLPGIPLALARPDLHIVLIEPLLRRSGFLEEAIAELELDHVSVVRARAEDVRPTGGYDVVTARAVAPLARLAGWTLPLLRPGGRLLAVKGRSVVEELDESAASLAKMGAESWTVEEVGTDLIEPTVRVAVVVAGRAQSEPTRRGRQRRKKT